ncbi:hypothetical protein QVD17_25713 [Tagetes erecta]|uniref:PHD finger protein ALFIN-LIKE n=1 Tax=Tagetes erecta TaxID=13708 RepID=A0AAD8KK04_TARER|nr:hypothetical protein QVD17_25713 [Tagetes erecta]
MGLIINDSTFQVLHANCHDDLDLIKLTGAEDVFCFGGPVMGLGSIREALARKRLFNMINDLPTIFEVVSGAAKKNHKEKFSVANHSKSNSRVRDPESQGKLPPLAMKDDDEEEEEEEEEDGETLCGACGENYASDEFWICCDICEKWFHGKCVKITPARAEHIKQYKCPTCNNKRARPYVQSCCLLTVYSDSFLTYVAVVVVFIDVSRTLLRVYFGYLTSVAV